MEHLVDGVEAIQETKGDGVGAQLHYDLIWFQKCISELLRGTGSMEELHLDVGPTPNWEFWSRDLRSVRSSLIPELCLRHVFS